MVFAPPAHESVTCRTAIICRPLDEVDQHDNDADDYRDAEGDEKAYLHFGSTAAPDSPVPTQSTHFEIP